MDLYALTVFIHVAAAVALLGGSVIASPAVRTAIQRAQTTEEMRAYLALGRPLLVLEPAAALAVFASGVYLASVAGFWTLGWVQVAAACWVVNAALAGAMVKPAIGRITDVAATAADGPVPRELDALRSPHRWLLAGDVMMAVDASMLYVMTMKPELTGSLLAVAVAVPIVTTARRLGRGVRRLAGAASPVSEA